MITLFERDTVADYDTWRESFEAFAPTLRDKGVLASRVYQSVEDPDDVTVAHDFASVEAARAFLQSQELADARPGAGVTETPSTWITTSG